MSTSCPRGTQRAREICRLCCYVRASDGRNPFSGFSSWKRCRIWRSTGISLSTHSIRSFPSSARDRSFAHNAFVSGSPLSTSYLYSFWRFLALFGASYARLLCFCFRVCSFLIIRYQPLAITTRRQIAVYLHDWSSPRRSRRHHCVEVSRRSRLLINWAARIRRFDNAFRRGHRWRG